MKKIFFLLFVVLTTLLTFSCKKEENYKGAFVQLYGIDDYGKAKDELKMYARYGVYTDGVAKIYLANLPNSDKVLGEVLVNYRPTKNESISNGGDFFIGNKIVSKFSESGDYRLSEPSAIQNNSFEMGEELKKQFGNQTQYKLVRDGQVIYDKTIYTPNSIQFSTFNNNDKIPFTNYYGISRNDFNLSWNADKTNSNGVLLVLVWSRNKLNTPMDQLSKGDYYYKAAWLPDEGAGSIPSEFFSAVPKDAVFNLELIRANIEIIKGTDSRTYKLYAFSQDTKMCSLLD